MKVELYKINTETNENEKLIANKTSDNVSDLLDFVISHEEIWLKYNYCDTLPELIGDILVEISNNTDLDEDTQEFIEDYDNRMSFIGLDNYGELDLNGTDDLMNEIKFDPELTKLVLDKLSTINIGLKLYK